jgi:hypothetical protein
MWDAERGLETMREAVQRRPSVMAHLFRADAEIYLASDLTDLPRARQMVEAAIRDISAAKQMLPGNAYALWTSLYAHLCAAHLHARAHEPARRQQALADAREDARALEPFALIPDACFARWFLLREENKQDTLREQLARVSAQTGSPYASQFHALILYRHKDLAGCLAALDQGRGSFVPELFRPLVLAEMDGNAKRGLAAYTKLAARDLNEAQRLDCLFVLRFLGQRDQSQAGARDLTGRESHLPAVRRERHRHFLQFATGEISADQLLQALAGSRQELCRAHYDIALTLLSQGDRSGAREHFRAALATQALMPFAYDLSWVFLGRMEEDPEWPRWLKLNQ